MNLDDLTTTARLALLDIPDPEKLAHAFTEMLHHFEKMNEVDVSGLEPTTHALLRENRLRKDVVTNDDRSDELLARAADAKGRFFRIPNVL